MLDGSGAERGRTEKAYKNAKAFFLFLLTWHPERKGREELGAHSTGGRPEFPLLPLTAETSVLKEESVPLLDLYSYSGEEKPRTINRAGR